MTKIFIATISHKHGVFFFAAKTENGLREQLGEYVREWWDRELPDEQIPAATQSQIEAYFEQVDYEYLELSEPVEVYE